MRAMGNDLLEGVKRQQPLGGISLDHLHDVWEEVVQVADGDVT